MLAIVIPAYNEEVSIGPTVNSLRRKFPKAKLVVVNDGSRDSTKEIAMDNGAIVYSHILNRGLGAALGTGIKAALNEKADIIVTFDADLQHEAGDIKRLIQPIEDKRADAVLGSRFMKQEDLHAMPRMKVIGNKFLTGLTNILAGSDITDSQSGLRAFDRVAAERLLILCDGYDVSSEIVHELSRHRIKVIEIPIKAIYDKRSKTKGTNFRSGLYITWGLLLRRLGLKK